MPDEFYDGSAEYDSEATFSDGGSGPESKDMAKVRKSRTKQQNSGKKCEFGDMVITKLTENTHYPDADALLSAFTTANTNLKARRAEMDASRQTVEEKRANLLSAEADWDVKFDALADHVQSVSGGNLMKLETSGLDVQTEPTPITELLAPAKVTARSNGVAGVVKLRWTKVRGVTHYIVQRSTANPNDEASWETLDTVSAGSFEDTGLTSGTKYSSCISGKGFNAISGWSQTVSIMAP